MADAIVGNSTPQKSTLSSDDLVALAEAQRARILDNASEFKKAIAPSQLAETAKIAASESFDNLKDGIIRQPLLAGSGALAIAAFAAAAYWGHSSSSRNLKPAPDGSTDATLAAADISVPQSAQSGGSPLTDIMSLVPKLGIAVAGGYLLERVLPRREGEPELWNEVRENLVRNVRERSREHISGLALSRTSPVPWLGIATIAARLLLKR